MRPSFSVLVFGIFVAYIAYTIWSFYLIFVPTTCTSKGSGCLKPYLARNPKLTLYLYATTSKDSARSAASRKNLLGVFKNLQPSEESSIELNYTAPLRTCKNGTLFVHAYLVEGDVSPEQGGWLMYQSAPMSRYAVPEASTFQLVGGSNKPELDSSKTGRSEASDKLKPFAHLHSKVIVSLMAEDVTFDRQAIPPELYRFLMLTEKSNSEYLPILYVDEFSTRAKDLLLLNESCGEQPITLQYRPISFGKLRLWVNMRESLIQLMNLGFTEKDVDEVKGLFVDTNLYLLLLTFFIAAFHLLFDFLAFKNDISYWRNRKSMTGLSSRTVIWRCVSTLIIFLYLLDEQTSLLVLVPAGIGAVIEIWKVFRAFKIKIIWSGRFPSLKLGDTNKSEQETADLDSKAMKYLSYVLYPLLLAGAIYSLLYTPHKSWYSWCVQSLVNGVYAFGFIFMLPQLFINYKLKSVAHLPWRAFMYKAFNTFIDDVFAFIITMPTAHRLACFRDDVVFLIYLYQRWLYPVDKSRTNEYGQTFDNDQSNDKKSIKKD